jgi:hypothetical protein
MTALSGPDYEDFVVTPFRRPDPWLRLLAGGCALLIVPLALAAGEPKKEDKVQEKEKPAVVIVPTHMPGNVFGDEIREFEFKVEARRESKGRVAWRLALGTATVKAGEAEFSATADAPAAVTIKIPVPPVKEGVVVHTRLTLSAVEDKQTKPIAAHEQDVWLFPKDPFADRSEWLKKLKITLYDPKGDTAKVLTAAKVPFEDARDIDAVLAVKEGVVIVGEGLSFKDEKGLGAALTKLAAAGRTVLILAPSGGEVAIPDLNGPAAEFADLSFRREIVRKLDKRLDPAGWPPDGKAVASSVVVKMGEIAITGEAAPGAAGWPWIEARAQTGKGRWALCGLGLIAKWEAGPTPRFFFVRMLEHLTDLEPVQPKKEDER